MSGFGGTAFKGLTQADVVNNLTSTSTTQPLSAAQGKVLNDNIATKPDVGVSNVKIRYGVETISAGTDRKRIDYGITFTNRPTVVLTPINDGNGAIIITSFDLTKSYVIALLRQGTITNDQHVYWIAIGD